MKRKKLVAFMCVLLVLSLVACGKSDSSKEAEKANTSVETSTNDTEDDVKVKENILSVEVTVPASFFEEESEDGEDTIKPTQESLDEKAKKEGDVQYTLNDDDTVTCKMSKATLKNELADMKKEIDEYFAECQDPENEDSYIESFKSIDYDDNLTEINITVDKSLYADFDCLAAWGIDYLAYYYQAFNGVPEKDRYAEVNFVDEDGNVLDTIDTKTVFDSSEDEEG